jgi:hypothetical protein
MLPPISRKNSTKSTTPRGKEGNTIDLWSTMHIFLNIPFNSLSVRHVIVGRNFGSYVTHETKHFIYFYLGQVAILLFKSG